jgi:hypothetical protein
VFEDVTKKQTIKERRKMKREENKGIRKEENPVERQE